MGCGRSKPEAKPAAAPTPAPAPAPAAAPARTLTQEETELINNFTINLDNGSVLEGITGVIGSSANDPIFLAKSYSVLLNITINQFDYNSFRIELKTRITNEIISKNITITPESLLEIVLSKTKEIISSRSTTSFTSDQATYYLSLIESVSASLEEYGDPNNRPTDFNSYLVNTLYTVAKSNPRPALTSATTTAVSNITTRFNLTLNSGAATTVSSFQNKKSFIIKELEKMKRNLKASTETFRNKEVNDNSFTGYNLEHNPLLPKDYAEF